MMAYFGWTDPKKARHYTMTANKKNFASLAAAKVGGGASVQSLFDNAPAIKPGSANTKCTGAALSLKKVRAAWRKN